MTTTTTKARIRAAFPNSITWAECFALASTVIELDYLRELNAELGFPLPDASVVAVDNQSAIYDAHNATGRRTRTINSVSQGSPVHHAEIDTAT